MKRKLLSICVAVTMLAVAVVGGTLAYFTDVEAETNVFTTGNVDINLTENFQQGSKLLPTTGKDADGNQLNAVEKEVLVTNVGSENAYVRVHIAIPSLLDNTDPGLDASEKILHFSYRPDSIGPGKWDWSKTAGAVYEGDWNCYTESIGGVDYNVYVVTYEAVLGPGETTADAIHQVYMDAVTTNEKITELNAALGESWKILVAAEGAQSAGFDDAYSALNTAFGAPGSYAVSWNP